LRHAVILISCTRIHSYANNSNGSLFAK